MKYLSLVVLAGLLFFAGCLGTNSNTGESSVQTGDQGSNGNVDQGTSLDQGSGGTAPSSMTVREALDNGKVVVCRLDVQEGDKQASLEYYRSKTKTAVRIISTTENSGYNLPAVIIIAEQQGSDLIVYQRSPDQQNNQCDWIKVKVSSTQGNVDTMTGWMYGNDMKLGQRVSFSPTQNQSISYVCNLYTGTPPFQPDGKVCDMTSLS